MQPSSREMQVMNSNPNQPVQEFDSTSTHRDFFEQILPVLPPSSWPELTAAAAIGGSHKSGDHEQLDLEHPFQLDHDQSASLASKLQQYQIRNGDGNSETAAVEMKSLLLQQQLLSEAKGPTGGGLQFPAGVPVTGCPGLSPMLPNLGSGHNIVNGSSLRPLHSEVEDSVQALYNVLAGSQRNTDQASNQSQHRQLPQDGSMQMQGHGMPAATGSAEGCGGAASQPKQRVRARRGQATDPHSIAERLRRERIAERMKSLQELVPSASKADKASMLDEIIDYVKFLQLQVKVLSMSRLGGAAAVGPLVPEVASEGTCTGGAPTASTSTLNNNSDTVTVTEHRVAKLMEEDMGSAMQYLQGKGLCLMPITLATAISSATGRNSIVTASGHRSDGGGSSSLSMSGLSFQTDTLPNGRGDASV